MQGFDTKKIRAALTAYLERQGHGSIAVLAEKAGIGVATIARLRDGRPGHQITWKKVAVALADQGFIAPINDELARDHEQTIPAAREHAALYSEWSLIADDLINLANYVRSPRLTPQEKLNVFTRRIETLADMLRRAGGQPNDSP